MNVGELKEILNQYPKDLPIFVDGYEGGLDDLNHHSKVTVQLNVNDEWWYGKHEKLIFEDDRIVGVDYVEGILLG